MSLYGFLSLAINFHVESDGVICAEQGMVLRISVLFWTKFCFAMWPPVGRKEKVVQGQKKEEEALTGMQGSWMVQLI